LLTAQKNIDHYHAVERVQIEAQLHKVSLDAFAALAQIPLSLWQAGYSKEEEFEADREGLRLAASAGYSPRGAIDLLTRFVQLDHEYVIHDISTGKSSCCACAGDQIPRTCDRKYALEAPNPLDQFLRHFCPSIRACLIELSSRPGINGFTFNPR
jgi:Zn-dependent protease with chaperone function